MAPHLVHPVLYAQAMFQEKDNIGTIEIPVF